jgi:hypothetical protein
MGYGQGKIYHRDTEAQRKTIPGMILKVLSVPEPARDGSLRLTLW